MSGAPSCDVIGLAAADASLFAASERYPEAKIRRQKRRLRPTEDSPGLLESMAHRKVYTHNIQEARDFHVPSLMDLFNNFIKEHTTKHPDCTHPTVTMPPTFEKKFGTGYKEVLRCSTCGYHTESHKLYQEAEIQGGATRGPKPTRKAVQLSMVLSKLPVGITGATTLLSATETGTQSGSKLQKITNNLTDVVVGEIKDSLADNRATLRKVCAIQGEDVKDGEPVLATAAVDGAYNNPSYHTHSQNSTQVTVPVIEKKTKGDMLIGFGFASKLCTCRRDGKDRQTHGPSCKANFPPADPIGKAEEVLAGRAVEGMQEKNPVLLDKVLTDNDSHITKGVRHTTKNISPTLQVEKLDCEVHVSRGQRRKMFRISTVLSDQIVSGITGYSAKVAQTKRTWFATALGRAVSKRCSTELRRAREKYPQNDDLFKLSVQQAKDNIVNCFSGNHTNCHSTSFMCRAGPDHKPAYLPRREHIVPTENDIKYLQAMLNFRFSFSWEKPIILSYQGQAYGRYIVPPGRNPCCFRVGEYWPRTALD
ncbi:hypothetical protein Bbelb_110450 [Branchiostoma belcheri]|nr:hypothetical protein Bbelb_110450 [Branchiostoma belcheri]